MLKNGKNLKINKIPILKFTALEHKEKCHKTTSNSSKDIYTDVKC